MFGSRAYHSRYAPPQIVDRLELEVDRIRSFRLLGGATGTGHELAGIWTAQSFSVQLFRTGSQIKLIGRVAPAGDGSRVALESSPPMWFLVLFAVLTNALVMTTASAALIVFWLVASAVWLMIHVYCLARTRAAIVDILSLRRVE